MSEAQVLAAARRLVEVFGAHDTGGYFASFAPDASFLFHDGDRLQPDRAAYEELWASWERDGFRVEGCRSLEPRVQLLADDVAVFTHRVRTRLAGGARRSAQLTMTGPGS